MTIFFVHGLLPDTITSVVPGGWSIAVEMMFYATFPLLMLQITSTRRAVVAVVACLIFDAALHALIVHLANEQSADWREVYLNFGKLYFIHQMPCFLLGIGAFQLAGKKPRLLLDHPILSGAIAVLPMLIIWLARSGIRHTRRCIWIRFRRRMGLCVCDFAFTIRPHKIIVNRVVCWIGKVSFSAYLVHFALMTIFSDAAELVQHFHFKIIFLLLASTTIALSTISYLLIEAPIIRFGNKLARMVSLRPQNALRFTRGWKSERD